MKILTWSYRAKKFGIEAPEVVDDKKKSRAERFGLPTPAANGGGAKKGGAAPVDPEMEAKKKTRAERFGLTVNQKRVSSRVVYSAEPSSKSSRNHNCLSKAHLYCRKQNLKAPTSQSTPRN